ncbi:cytochrome P450 2C19-like isoform X1 [Alligator sinensis]|uniref:Cytochrome P450 2C19-like isoform X1 n=2 Tax=Alligator sinensis TaxID=38654 RepID=A0A1U8DFE8_ALLSI|nr:cytochrome P450 2C19-like isoform X1 [Alligator sinensis]
MELLGASTAVLAFCVTCLLVLAWRKPPLERRSPPGPIPLPILGNLLQLRVKDARKTLRKMSERYGPIFTVFFGSDRVVVLYGYDVVKEVLVDRSEEFLDRGSFPSADKTNKGLGIIMSNRERWKQMRRFSLTTLRNFGMGKKSIEERIQEEAQFLLEELRAKDGHPFDPTVPFSCATANVICHILFGERFDYQDSQYRHVLRVLSDSFRLESSVAGQLYNVFPALMDHLPGPHQTFFQNISTIQGFVASRVRAHEDTVDLNAPRDFIDSFLLKMEQEKQNPKTEFTRENLMMTTYDLFFAGTETTSTSLRYAIMVLLEHPAVEEKIQEEIDQVIGRERGPTIKDRAEMPYMDAVIHEVQRYIDLLPLGVPRITSCNTHIHGYHIPKGCTVYPMLSSVLHDPKHFKNPEMFDPEHFLDDKGAVKKNEAFMAFSAGKRMCIGESLARMQLFLFLTAILQNFRLQHAPGVSQLDLTPDVSGFGNIPRPFLLRLAPR